MSGRTRCRENEAALPQTVLNITLVEPETMTVSDLSRALGKVDRIEAWVVAVRAQATALAAHGENVPGYKLVTRRVSRRWGNETVALRALRRVIRGTGLKQADLFERRLKSPARVEKLFSPLGRRAVDAVCVQVSISENGVVLASESDPRIAVLRRNKFERVRRRPCSDARAAFQPRTSRARGATADERVRVS